MKKLLSLLLIICSIGVAYADDKSTVTSLKYVTDELNTRQDKFGANDGKAMTFTNVAGGNLPRDVKESLGTSTTDPGLPTVSAVNTGIATKQDKIGAANTNTVVTYTGTPGTLGQKGIYQDTGTYAEQSDNLIQASTFNAALRNGLNNEFVCAGTDDGTPNGNCWLWTIDNTTNETITVHGKNLFNPNEQPVVLEVYLGVPLNQYTTGNYWLSMTRKQGADVPSGAFGVVFRKNDSAGPGARWFVNNGEENSSFMPNGSPLNFISTDDVRYIGLAVYPGNVATWAAFMNAYNIQIEQGTRATEYEPYVGETVNVYIPQNQ